VYKLENYKFGLVADLAIDMYSATHGKSLDTNNDLVDALVSQGIIKSDSVEKAMREVDRGDFVIDDSSAYMDRPQKIGYYATISAPHMHSHALEWLKDYLKEGAKVLDVGSGSGVLCALFLKMMNNTGTVVGIEHIDELTELGKINLSRNHKEALDNKSIIMVTGDGREGYEEHSPYDVIHVGAAAAEVPEALVKQLAVGGILMIPVGPEHMGQDIKMIKKVSEDEIKEETLLGVMYIPL
jgi:protein-L-isoaspartate(D-aspartate) O-methyltransferase